MATQFVNKLDGNQVLILSDKLNEKVNCECGCEIVKTHLKRHKATKKHIDIMNKK